ncbi:MAG: hypothetical protein H6Q90_3374 [Deltaproteobacteria bacterium]|nr:hypothetical protein [Deltaproteobacteria bacterium]
MQPRGGSGGRSAEVLAPGRAVICAPSPRVRSRPMGRAVFSAHLASSVKQWSFMLPQPSLATSATEQDLRPRARTLSWMASLSVAAGDVRAAEGYLLELLAWCAFADRDVIDTELDEDGL